MYGEYYGPASPGQSGADGEIIVVYMVLCEISTSYVTKTPVHSVNSMCSTCEGELLWHWQC